jgi:hypothetical protein
MGNDLLQQIQEKMNLIQILDNFYFDFTIASFAPKKNLKVLARQTVLKEEKHSILT